MNPLTIKSWKNLVHNCEADRDWNVSTEMGSAILDADFYIRVLQEELKMKDATIARLQAKDLSTPFDEKNFEEEIFVNSKHVLCQKEAEISKWKTECAEQWKQFEHLKSRFTQFKAESEVIEAELTREIDNLVYVVEKCEDKIDELQNTLNDYYFFIYQNKVLLLNADGFETLFPELTCEVELFGSFHKGFKPINAVTGGAKPCCSPKATFPSSLPKPGFSPEKSEFSTPKATFRVLSPPMKHENRVGRHTEVKVELSAVSELVAKTLIEEDHVIQELALYFPFEMDQEEKSYYSAGF